MAQGHRYAETQRELQSYMHEEVDADSETVVCAHAHSELSFEESRYQHLITTQDQQRQDAISQLPHVHRMRRAALRAARRRRMTQIHTGYSSNQSTVKVADSLSDSCLLEFFAVKVVAVCQNLTQLMVHSGHHVLLSSLADTLDTG